VTECVDGGDLSACIYDLARPLDHGLQERCGGGGGGDDGVAVVVVACAAAVVVAVAATGCVLHH